MNLDLTGKTALVCGSSKGIGKAIAIELALLGASITLVSRSETALSSSLKDLDSTKNQHHDFLVADFSDYSTVQKAINNHIDKSKKSYNILINNTGGPAGGQIENAKPEEFIQAFNNHLLCNHILVEAVLPAMKRSGYGRIVNVISTSVKAPLNGLGVSNTIRGAVANWGKTMANEVGIYGITVNNVLPGATATERLESIISNKAVKGNITKDLAADKMKSTIPLGRFGEPNEIAAAAAFICTPAAAYISGTNIVVDGGRTPTL